MKPRFMHCVLAIWMSVATNSAVAGDESAQSTKASAQQVRSLSPADVHSLVRDARALVFDASPTDIFTKYRIPGAKRVEYDQVSARDLPADKTATIVFYCMNERCSASSVAAERARELGWGNVYIMPKGIQGWMDAGLPTDSG